MFESYDPREGRVLTLLDDAGTLAPFPPGMPRLTDEQRYIEGIVGFRSDRESYRVGGQLLDACGIRAACRSRIDLVDHLVAILDLHEFLAKHVVLGLLGDLVKKIVESLGG